MANKRVLIVEDDPDMSALLGNQLEKLGYEKIYFAATGEEAIAFIENNELPEIIFMDIFLKGNRNGIDTASEIYKKAKIPIVFSSAPENLYILEDAKFIKNSGFLSKPFNIEKIQKSIESLADEALKQTPEYIEANRLNKLIRYEILDTPREGNFDRITKLAATLFRVPIALVSIVDEDRIWFKSKYGFREKQISKSPELFASSFLSNEVHYTGKDHDGSGLTNPIFAHDSGFKFYASAPLTTSDGHNLGLLCVIDRKPREITEEEIKLLVELAAIIMDEMEMRLAARIAFRMQREFLNTAIHDLKNPLAAVLGFSEFLEEEEHLDKIQEYNGYIKQSADNMLQIVEGLLQNSLMELNQIRLHAIPIHFSEIVESVLIGNRSQARKKKQEVKVNIEDDPIINADPLKLGEALDNLVSNAIKYSPVESKIEITLKEEDGKAHFEVKDHGPGLTSDEKKKVFEKFSRLSAKPTGGETSTGLGLSISKKLVELHGGIIKAESKGKQRGTTFSIEMPLASEIEKEELEQQQENR
ncbi:MAG TPA: ATP-binding protein [Bacteroidia bacterium]|jgi:signal transduction histidine kinase